MIFGSEDQVLGAMWGFLQSTGLSNYVAAALILTISVATIRMLFMRD